MTTPELERLLPHRPPMLLLDAIEHADAGSARCSVRVGPDHPFLRAGRIDGVALVELMAQAAAVHTGVRAAAHGRRLVGGSLLGIPDLEIAIAHVALGDLLSVEAREIWASGDMASYECSVSRHGELVARGTLSVLKVEADA